MISYCRLTSFSEILKKPLRTSLENSCYIIIISKNLKLITTPSVICIFIIHFNLSYISFFRLPAAYDEKYNEWQKNRYSNRRDNHNTLKFIFIRILIHAHIITLSKKCLF